MLKYALAGGNDLIQLAEHRIIAFVLKRAGSTGAALRAVRPFQPSHHAGYLSIEIDDALEIRNKLTSETAAEETCSAPPTLAASCPQCRQRAYGLK
jgi:hypothetical protein